MNNRHVGSGDSEDRDTQESVLKVKDLVRYLSGLVNLNRNEKTGNLKLSEGLRQLTRALQPHSNRSVLTL